MKPETKCPGVPLRACGDPGERRQEGWGLQTTVGPGISIPRVEDHPSVPKSPSGTPWSREGKTFIQSIHSPTFLLLHHSGCIMLDAPPITSQLTCFGIHLGQSERIAVLILEWDFFFSSLAFLMHYAIVLESGCEGPFHPTKCLIGVPSVSAAALSFFIPLCSSSLISLPPFEAKWSDTNEFVCWGRPSPPCSAPLRALQPSGNETKGGSQNTNS